MRIVLAFCCATLIACAHKDDQRVIIRHASVGALDSLTPISQPDPVTPWTPPPAAPGDTTPQGSPTEHALLRWVHLLAPDSFPILPKVVRDSLVGRHCQIPVPWSRPDNVVTGAFTAKGAVEWAAICSVSDTSQILVMNATNGTVVDSLSKSANSQWIQSNGNNTWLFSRMIDVVPMSTLAFVPADTTNENILYYGAFLPKPIDHDGINEAFLDKASETLYFANGRWISVGSSD
jgi:hypothetical protein